jgi:hypothetical protein
MDLKQINDNLQIAKQEMEEIKETNIFESLDKSISVCEECHHSIASHNGLCDRCYHEAMAGMKYEPDYLTSKHLDKCSGCANCEL